jgi:hypothetical protein
LKPHNSSPALGFSEPPPSTMSFIPKLSQSKSKAEFFERLGWSENEETHKQLYQMMMVCCIAAGSSISRLLTDVHRKKRPQGGRGRVRTVKI